MGWIVFTVNVILAGTIFQARHQMALLTTPFRPVDPAALCSWSTYEQSEARQSKDQRRMPGVL